MFLLDASVWVAAGIPAHPHHESAANILRSTAPVSALDLTFYEVANAIGRGYRQPEQAEKLCTLIRRRCRDEPLCLDAELLAATLEGVGRHGLSAYDAAYVAAASRNGWILLSFDVGDLVSKGLAVTPDAADYP